MCVPRLRFRSFKGHGIWTIILLVFTLTTYTSTTILNCPILPDRNKEFSPVNDGNLLSMQQYTFCLIIIDTIDRDGMLMDL